MSLQADKPLVAIVTPVFNGERFLAETMECVQSLDYPRLVHVILDNASTDATPEIIKRYSNCRVPILASRNPVTIPMVANFNAAVAMVPEEASYFRLLCADDTMSVDAISRKVQVAERDPAIGLVGCLCHTGAYPRGASIPKNREVFEGREIVRSFFLREHNALYGTEVLIRRSKLNEQPVFYDSIFEGGFDNDANIRICMTSKFGFVHGELAVRRTHETNAIKKIEQSKGHLSEWLLLLDRYGKTVLSQAEYRSIRAAFRRHYLRRALLMRYKDHNKALFKQHMDSLRKRGDPALWLDFAGALLEWVRRAITRGAPSVPNSERWTPAPSLMHPPAKADLPPLRASDAISSDYGVGRPERIVE
jgi:glycosyltransferase involved in cell wall biosynthesis